MEKTAEDQNQESVMETIVVARPSTHLHALEEIV